MVRFDTLNKKPKVYSVAVVFAVALAAVIVIRFTAGNDAFWLANAVLAAAFLAVIILLVRAFLRQLRYNPYSYNTIYYSGFAIFLCSALFAHVRTAAACTATGASNCPIPT